MGFRVLHFSSTPLAGAPIRLVQALREHTDHEVRLVDLQRWGLYDHDLVFSEQPDEVVELAAKAGIIHSTTTWTATAPALPRSISSACGGGHGPRAPVPHPPGVRGAGDGRQPLRGALLPPSLLVIAQSQERFYPQARVVPNLLPCHSAALMPGTAEAGRSIAFTDQHAAPGDRWNSRGSETLALLRQVARATGGRSIASPTDRWKTRWRRSARPAWWSMTW